MNAEPLPDAATPTDPPPPAQSLEAVRDTVSCPFCRADVDAEAKKCRHCGEWVARACSGCGTPLRGEWAARGTCVECQGKGKSVVPHRPTLVVTEPKSKGAAALSAFFLGGLGAHRFYLGNPFAGLFYLMFCWTFIPSILGIGEGVRLAVMDEDEFHRRYSGQPLDEFEGG